jgi:zinc protease
MLKAFKFSSALFQILLVGILFLIPIAASATEDKLTVSTLPNGLKVFVQEDHARKVATIQIWVMVGSADESQSELGISHLIEHMAFKGTERRGVGKIAAEIEALGGETNAYTSWDETVFHVTVPSHAVSEGIDVLTDAVLRPSIDPGELNKEKQVVIEEILEGEERPERKASKLLFNTAYEKHPYKYPVIGYKDVVEGFTRDNVLSFRKKWYVPENMFMVIVGDVEPAKVLADVQKYTSDLKPVGLVRGPRPVEPAQKQVRTAVAPDRNSRETRLHMAFHVPAMKNAEVNALDLAGDILGARDNSRLVRTLKKEKGLVNTIAAYSMTPKDPGLMLVSVTLDAKNIEPVVSGIIEEIVKLRKEPPSKDELEQAKIHIESQHIYARETVQGVARDLGNSQADVGDANYSEKYLKLNAAVTPEDVSAAMRDYIKNPNITISILAPEAGADQIKPEKLEEIVKTLDPVTKVAVADNVQESKVIVRTLPNGIKLVLTPDDSNPVISMRIGCLGGKRFETKETEGIMNFVAQMLDKGTSHISEIDIAKQVDDMGGRLSGFSGYDSFGVSTTFFSRYLDRALELLADIYQNPAFPQQQLERERALVLNRIKTEPDRPVVFAINALNATVFDNHPYGFDKEGTLTTVSGFNAEDLRQAYERFAVPANTVITVVGDMDPEKTVQAFTETFGKIPAKKLDAPDIPKMDQIAKQRDKVIRIPRAKAHIAVGFQATTVSDDDRFPLEVLNNILAGQGGRLFRELRDKQSLCYTVTAFTRPGVDTGIFAFYIASEESKADRSLAGLWTEIDKVRKTAVAPDELHRSINNLIGNHFINLQSSWSRAENTVLNTLYGLGPNFDVKYMEKIAKVTADDVLRVAQKYLDPNRAGVVKILPEENENKNR